MKKNLNLITAGFVFGLFMFGIFGNAYVASAAVKYNVAADPSRNLLVSAELWSKYQYNKTEAGAIVTQFGLSAAGDIKTINDTLPAGFRTTSSGLEDGIVSDLNITGGIKYSNDVFDNFVVEPVDYSVSGETLLARQLSLIPETELSRFGEEQPLQFFNHETKDLSDVQNDVAGAIKRTWTETEGTFEGVNVTHAYLRIGVSFEIFKELIDIIRADSRWDPVDGMTTAQLTGVIDDYIELYTYGLMVNFGNTTALQEESGKSNWDLSNELVATLDNKTDGRLSQFTTDSSFITHGLLGYIMEYGITDSTVAMVANGVYGSVNAPDRGPFRGMEIGYSQSQFTDVAQSVIYIWYDAFDAVVDIASDFKDGVAIMLTNIVPFKEKAAPTEAVPIALTVMLSLALMFIAILWQGDGSFEKYGKKVRSKKDGEGMKTIIITAAAFFVPLILILNTYYSWF